VKAMLNTWEILCDSDENRRISNKFCIDYLSIRDYIASCKAEKLAEWFGFEKIQRNNLK